MNMPGKSPPLKRSPMEVDDPTPNKTRGMDGGIIMPKAPAVAIKAVTNLLS